MYKKIFQIALCLFVCIFGLNGCIPFIKSKPSSTALLIKGSVENSSLRHYIKDVPAVRQKGNLCGPAALSSVFRYYNVNISQKEIAKDIYLIPVHGVLNIDLENYARDKGFWTYVSYEKNLSHLKENIRNNIPALVLTRSPSYIPFKKTYHYQVLIGYEDEEKAFIAHSGKKANSIVPYRNFIKDWEHAEYWSLVACPREKVTWNLDAQGYNNLGLLLEKEGKLDLAIEEYKNSIRKEERFDTLFNLGNVYLKKKENKKAITCYKYAVKLNPEFADGYNNLAYTYMEEDQDLDKAISYARKALELKPANKVYYLDTLGMIQFKKGLLDQAVKSFREASELSADKKMSSLIYYHLGLTELKLGLLNEAKETFKKSVELDPHSHAKEALRGIL